MKLKTQTALALLLVLAAVNGEADSWTFRSGEQKYKFSKGFIVAVGVDAKKSAIWPRFYVRISDRTKLLAYYPGMSFDTIIASPDEELFVGLSNRGIPSTAVVVFDREGNILHLAYHDSEYLQYCRQSVTMDREWYDRENPNVRFTDGGGIRTVITLRNCAGDQVNLVRPDQKALDTTNEQG